MYIKQILAKKDRRVLSVEPETLVMDVVKFMTKYDIGSVIILGEGKLKGIFTERDVLHLSAELGLDLFKKSVSEVMTTSITTMTPEDDVDELLSIMLQKKDSSHAHLRKRHFNRNHLYRRCGQSKDRKNRRRK